MNFNYFEMAKQFERQSGTTMKRGDLVKFRRANKKNKNRTGIITEGPYGMVNRAGYYDVVEIKWNDGSHQRLDPDLLEVASEAR